MARILVVMVRSGYYGYSFGCALMGSYSDSYRSGFTAIPEMSLNSEYGVLSGNLRVCSRYLRPVVHLLPSVDLEELADGTWTIVQ